MEIRLKSLILVGLILTGLLVITGCGGGTGTDGSTTAATITGTYLTPGANASGAGIRVSVTGPDLPASVTTNGFGIYSIQVGSMGTYIITAAKSGFLTDSSQSVVVNGAATFTMPTVRLVSSNAPATPTFNY